MTEHVPTRGSDVEAWIKQIRDECIPNTDPWYALDDLLDDYRLRADTGQLLSEMEPTT